VSKREEVEDESVFTAENREEKGMISLGGTATTISGKITKSNFFRSLGHNLDEYEDIQLTKKEALSLHNHLSKLSTGSTAMVPLFCGGDLCPFRSRCPLYKMGKHPIGKQCIIETQLLKEWIVRYFEEYDVDPNNFTEVGYISELAEIEILLMRINMNLSLPDNAELVTDQTIGVTQQGAPIIQKALSPFMDLKDKLQARKSKIVKLMVGDRQEKYKKEAALKQKPTDDPSSQQAALRTKLDSLARKIETAETSSVLSPQSIIDAEFDDTLE